MVTSKEKLFAASCVSLMTTAVAFSIRGDVGIRSLAHFTSPTPRKASCSRPCSGGFASRCSLAAQYSMPSACGHPHPVRSRLHHRTAAGGAGSAADRAHGDGADHT